MDQWQAIPEYADISEKLFLVSITTNKLRDIATQAARWGADQELEACCEWLRSSLPGYDKHYADCLHTARRPKPPSLREQALEALDRMDQLPTAEDQHIIRRALESLPD